MPNVHYFIELFSIFKLFQVCFFLFSAISFCVCGSSIIGIVYLLKDYFINHFQILLNFYIYKIVEILFFKGEKDEPDKQEHLRYGGPRFVTFMIYLSDVEAGGRTVFPTIGVSVPPEAGSALFWFNLDSGSDK